MISWGLSSILRLSNLSMFLNLNWMTLFQYRYIYAFSRISFACVYLFCLLRPKFPIWAGHLPVSRFNTVEQVIIFFISIVLLLSDVGALNSDLSNFLSKSWKTHFIYWLSKCSRQTFSSLRWFCFCSWGPTCSPRFSWLDPRQTTWRSGREGKLEATIYRFASVPGQCARNARLPS